MCDHRTGGSNDIIPDINTTYCFYSCLNQFQRAVKITVCFGGFTIGLLTSFYFYYKIQVSKYQIHI